MTCASCREPVNPRDHYAEVIGWEKPGRGAGGRSGSSIILRKRTGAVMCSPCALRKQHTPTSFAGQGELWSE